MGRQRLCGGVGVAGARGEEGRDRGGEHGEVAAQAVGETDAADGLERGEVADARVRLVEDVLLEDAEGVVLAEVVRDALHQVVGLAVAHARDVDALAGGQRTLVLGVLELREGEGDVELHPRARLRGSGNGGTLVICRSEGDSTSRG